MLKITTVQFIVFCLAAADFSFPPKNSARPHTPQGRIRKREVKAAFASAKSRFRLLAGSHENTAKCAYFAETTVQFCGRNGGMIVISMGWKVLGGR